LKIARRCTIIPYLKNRPLKGKEIHPMNAEIKQMLGEVRTRLQQIKEYL